jgi:hypothetical protein
MKLEVFERIMKVLQEQQQRSHEMCKFGVDLINYEDGWSEVISLLFRAYYGEEGADWIDWYMFERESLFGDKINQAHDGNGHSICYDIPSLWKCVEECRVSVDFEEYSLPKQKRPLSPADLENLFGKFL